MFVVLLQVQMTDAKINEHSSEHVISIGIKLGETIMILEKKAVVTRTGDEEPDLLLTANVTMDTVYSIRLVTGIAL